MPGANRPDLRQRIHRHHRLHGGQPPRQVPGGAQRGSDQDIPGVDDLVVGKQVPVDRQARLFPQITTGNGQLGVCFRRCAACPEQLRCRVTRQHAVAGSEQGRRVRSGCQIGGCARKQIDVVEQPAILVAAQHPLGEQPTLHGR
ncbi:MAG: hypothetical protein ACRDS0_36225 [Pseudonocardiaceae bacterium]